MDPGLSLPGSKRDEDQLPVGEELDRQMHRSGESGRVLGYSDQVQSWLPWISSGGALTTRIQQKAQQSMEGEATARLSGSGEEQCEAAVARIGSGNSPASSLLSPRG